MNNKNTSLRAQTEAKVKAGRDAKPEFMQGVDEVIAQAKEFQLGQQALKLGARAPNFTLPNASGKLIELNDLLKQGPVVVTFYRGSWCPYCNLQLQALQSRMSEITALGAQLIAISPQLPDDSLSESEISKMDFNVLSDAHAKVASSYGVAWQVPAFLLDHMKVDRQLDLEAINGGNANILPIPASYVLNTLGNVTWRYLDVDYRTRSEPSDIINALQKLA